MDEHFREKLEELRPIGIENILALRGDCPSGGECPEGDFAHASDLIRMAGISI